MLRVPPTLLSRELAPSSEVTQDRLCSPVGPGQQGWACVFLWSIENIGFGIPHSTFATCCSALAM